LGVPLWIRPAEYVNAVAGGSLFAAPPAGGAGGRPFGCKGVVGGEISSEGRPAVELEEVVGAIDVEVAGDDDDLWRVRSESGEELRAGVADDGDIVRAEQKKVGEDAGGGFEAHAVEDVAAAGDGVDALDVVGEGWAAEGVEVLLERGDEFGIPPLIAMDEDGGLRGEEEGGEGEGEGGEDLATREPTRDDGAVTNGAPGSGDGLPPERSLDGAPDSTAGSKARVKSMAIRGRRKASSG